MVYRGFRDGSRFHPGFDREAGAARLQSLLDKHGRIDREVVKRDAKSERSPLHAAFTWDPQEALDRLHDKEAQYLLTEWVTVTIEDGERSEIRAAFPVTITKDEPRSYVSREEAFAHPDYRAQVIQQAKAELRAFQRKYASLQELARVFAAIASLEEDAEAAA